MKTKHHNLLTGKIAIATLLTLVNLVSTSLPASAQVATSRIPRLSFTPPVLPNRGLPKGRARGGASRGELCQATSQPLTALVPSQQINSMETVGGMTIAPDPTLWFYVPYSLRDDNLVEFVLQDEQQNILYKTTVDPSQLKAGIVGVSLAKEATIEKDKLYHWYFLVYCEKDNPVFVEGWIQRVSINPELERQIQHSSPRDRIALLAANGIWYDALTQLAQMRDLHPNDTTLIDDWESLLKSAGFQILTSEPMSEPK